MLSLATRATLRHWRLYSLSARLLDAIMLVAGISIVVVASVDSLVTWPSNSIWISPNSLEHGMALVLIPTWVWLLLGFALLSQRSRARLRAVGAGRIVGLAVVAVFCLIVVIGGSVIGGDKGSLRVVQPGHRYQVSTHDLNDAAWTTVTVAEYRTWEARFLRGDAMFTLFGLLMLGGLVAVAAVRREAADAH